MVPVWSESFPQSSCCLVERTVEKICNFSDVLNWFPRAKIVVTPVIAVKQLRSQRNSNFVASSS